MERSMKLNKILFLGVLSLFLFSSFAFGQDKKMKSDKMDSKMGEKMMKTDKMDKGMMKGNMMHKDMMTKVDKDANGVAIKGYDAVSYFTDMKPMMGKSDFSYEWNGAKWQFTSEKNLDMFKANPNKYAPQYGGYCAYAVSKNMLAPVDPTAWTVVDGKLYLNNSGKVKKMWKEDIPGNIKTANKNWKKLGMADSKSDMNKMKDMKKMDNMKKSDNMK